MHGDDTRRFLLKPFKAKRLKTWSEVKCSSSDGINIECGWSRTQKGRWDRKEESYGNSLGVVAYTGCGNS